MNYGIFRTKSFNETSPMYIMFYDMGAYATQVSVVAYQLIKSKDKVAPELQPQLTVLGVGYVYKYKFLCIIIKRITILKNVYLIY